MKAISCCWRMVGWHLLLCLGLLLELGSGQPLLQPTVSPFFSDARVDSVGDIITLPPLGVDARVTCVDSNTGRDCGLSKVDQQCSKDTPLPSLQLQYIGGSCSQSHHTQGHHAADYRDLVENGPDTNSDAVIVCQTNNNDVVMDEIVSVKSVFTLSLSSSSDTTTTTTLTCMISSLEQGTVLQQFTWNTSGLVDLYVEDVFCSLKVVGCGDSSGTCLVDATFSYEISNTGSVDVEILDVTRIMNNNDTRNLKALVMLKNGGSDTLLAGGTITATETDLHKLDICSGGSTANALQLEVKSATDDRTIMTTGVFEMMVP